MQHFKFALYLLVGLTLAGVLPLQAAPGAEEPALREGHSSRSRPAVPPRLGHSHREVDFGIYLGWPHWHDFYGVPPYWHLDPYRAYPQPVPLEPRTYIEQGPFPDEQQAVQPGYYWYHCAEPEGYYPYVGFCPGGWQVVEPAPPQP